MSHPKQRLARPSDKMDEALPLDEYAGELEAFHELGAYTLTRGDATFIHQHVVDAYAAQRAAPTTKPITLTFALVGLCLHVDHGFSGREVQRAHMELAKTRREWPSFPLPIDRGSITAVDVMQSAPGSERDRAVAAWCASVWEAYRHSHSAVTDLLRGYRVLGRRLRN